MKAASVHEIKQQLKELDAKDLMEICLRLARFKKENKELLTFLLFEAADLANYITGVREEMDIEFSQVNTRNLYQAKKTIRKILRRANQYIRYTGDSTAEVEILLHYLTNFNVLNFSWQRSTQLVNLYKSQYKKIQAAIDDLHEDLQWDYQKQLEQLEFD